MLQPIDKSIDTDPPLPRLTNTETIRRKVLRATKDIMSLEAKIKELRAQKSEITRGVVDLGLNKKAFKLALALYAMEDEERELIDTSLMICGAALQLRMFNDDGDVVSVQ